MRCQRVLKQLSLFLDEMLEREAALPLSAHLGVCAACQKEFERLSRLRARLNSLEKVRAPEYLRRLVQHRLDGARNDSLSKRFKEFLEYHWSRIRTTERMWYVTRLLGTASTFIFFLALSSAMTPYLDLRAQGQERSAPSQNFRQQLGIYVLKNLGLMPVEMQRKPISPSEPRINDLYLLRFGESVSRAASDDSFSVFTVVDRSGSAKIQNVLEYPSDTRLLYTFNNMITSAQLRPASQNGRAVDSHLVLSFSKVSVYD